MTNVAATVSHPFSHGGSTLAKERKTRLPAGFERYRYGDSNPGFRRERAAS
jgi:hypothetical protein